MLAVVEGVVRVLPFHVHYEVQQLVLLKVELFHQVQLLQSCDEQMAQGSAMSCFIESVDVKAPSFDLQNAAFKQNVWELY